MPRLWATENGVNGRLCHLPNVVASAFAPWSKVAPEFGGLSIRIPLHVKRRNEMAVLVHQIDEGGMVHGVVAALQRDFLGVDPVVLDGLVDGGLRSGQSPQVRIEARQVVFEHRR